MRSERTKSSVEIRKSLPRKQLDPRARLCALRTAFVARFVVLREGRRSRAHRAIERMIWEECTTAQELAKMFREAFIENGDKLQPVERDLRRAMEHAEYSVDHFLEQYRDRSVLTFQEALSDYERSNRLLFGDDPEDVPRKGGWRVPGQNNG